DGHEILANSLALKLANITRATPNPPGGEIVHDASGEPTGVLKDAAQALVFAKVPPPTRAQQKAAIKRSLEHAASLGVTSVQHMSAGYDSMSIYAEMDERHELTARVYVAPMETSWQDLAKIGVRHAQGSSFYRIGAVKGFADGSLG